jgi:hypothetical protein
MTAVAGETLIFGGAGPLVWPQRPSQGAGQPVLANCGTVTESEVKITEHNPGTAWMHRDHLHKPVVKYQYSVEGMEYTGSRIAFGAMNSAPSAANAVVARYPSGASVTVRYDPEKPAEAVLETNTGGGGLLMVLGVGFLIFSVGSAVMGLVALVVG